MKKGIVLLMALLVLAVPVICRSQTAEKPIVLRYADTDVPGQPDYEGNMYFADLVKKRSNGKVIVEYYHSGQLGSDKAITQATIAGTIDIAKCSGGNFSEFSKALYFTDLPGLFKDMSHVRSVWQSKVRERISDQIKKETGLTVLMYDIDGGHPRELGNSKKPVSVPDDTKGLKIRTTGSPVEVALLKAWGASAVPVAWSETYTALQQKVVDGTYVQPIFTHFVGKFGEVLKYYTFVGQSWVTSVKVLGKAAEQKLGPENYKLVIEAAKEAELYKDTLTAAKDAEAIKGLKDAGVELIYPSAEQLKLWSEKSMTIWPQLVGAGKEIPEDLVKEAQAVAK